MRKRTGTGLRATSRKALNSNGGALGLGLGLGLAAVGGAATSDPGDEGALLGVHE